MEFSAANPSLTFFFKSVLMLHMATGAKAHANDPKVDVHLIDVRRIGVGLLEKVDTQRQQWTCKCHHRTGKSQPVHFYIVHFRRAAQTAAPQMK